MAMDYFADIDAISMLLSMVISIYYSISCIVTAKITMLAFLILASSRELIDIFFARARNGSFDI